MQPLRPNGVDATPCHQTGGAVDELSHLLVELDAIIAEIENAAEGSPLLDRRLHFGARVMAGHGQDIAGLLIGEGIAWPTVEAALDEAVPRYTSSLDAALDGERIIFVVRSEKRGRWGAMQRTGHEEILAWAATEAMARRLATLKCWRVEISAILNDRQDTDEVAAHADGRDAAAASAERPAPASAGRQTNRKEKDWEILF